MLFSVVQCVHRTPYRARYRYKSVLGILGKNSPWDACSLLESLGAKRAEFNAHIASFTLYFDSQKNNALSVEQSLLKLQLGDLKPKSTLVAPQNASQEHSLKKLLNAGVITLASRFVPLSWQALLAFSAALPLAQKAKNDLVNKGFTSHVLEAAAVGVSIVRRDYFAANITSFLLSLGEYLEHSIERRSDDLLLNLMQPNTSPVWIELESGQEKQIQYMDLHIGHHVVASAGLMIPVDGTVLKGEALVNQANMTGESVPAVKKRGDKVLSGTVIHEGRIVIYAEQVGKNAAAARIAQFVAQSLSEKSNTQSEAAQLADQLVPAVLGLAGVAWLVSGDLERLAAVVQADYSCALKLATPVAFKSAMYTAGANGVLVKGALALERLALADTFVFDKTGTLTTGDLKVTDVLTFHPDFSQENLICLAASIEEHYLHPMAQAVVEASRLTKQPHHFAHKEVQFIVAHGVASVVEGKRIVVGSKHFVEEDEHVDFSEYQNAIEPLLKAGKTLLYIGFGGKPLGVLALEDTLRTEAHCMIDQLKHLGVKKVVMLTGDRFEHAQNIAQTLGLDEFHAQLMPEDKAQILQTMIHQGAKIAFVGDGVNDAPALTGAQVGIAMHKGADIAQLASDIVLLQDDIEKIAQIKALALANQKLIGCNYQLILGLNSAILGAAALGIFSPVSAALLHNGSTISILLRAFFGVNKALFSKKKKG